MSGRDEFFDRAEREKLQRDFFAEAEEIFDALTADLTALEASLGRDGAAPSVVNRMFRGVHSLKGLSGSLGIDDVSALAHAVETAMERLRLAPERLDAATLDLLHDGVDQLAGLVRARRDGGRGGLPITALVERLRAAAGAVPEGMPGGGPGQAPAGAMLRRLDLDPRLRAALSEHEEVRLEAHLRAGRPVRLVRLCLPAGGFDEPLRRAVAWLGERAEVLGTIPESVTGEEARFAILAAGVDPIEPSAGALAGLQASVRDCALLDDSPAAVGVEAAIGDDELRGLSDTVRVPVTRLDELLSQTGDLGTSLGALAAATRRLRETHPGDRLAVDLDQQAGRLLPRLATLQRATLQARLVPLEQLFARLTRMVARAARAVGKEVDLHTMGGETEIDKAVSDELAAPLLHLLRNALDHGLEPPAGRLAARKPRRGRLVLCAFRRGGRVLLEVSDDGRGIDPAAVRAAAERRGLPPGAPLSAAEVLELIFRPGFSTAASVSEGSGRGVGLDAVGAALRRLKGTIEPRTIAGQGTTFTLSVPLSLALVRALIVVAGGRRFAIPLGVIRENLRLEAARLRGGAGSAEFYERPAGSLPLVRLRALFGATDGRPVASGVYAVIASAGGRDVGIVIDGFAGQQEVVVKPIGGWARELPGISGATDLGDATAVLVLDPESLPLGGARAGAAA